MNYFIKLVKGSLTNLKRLKIHYMNGIQVVVFKKIWMVKVVDVSHQDEQRKEC